MGKDVTNCQQAGYIKYQERERERKKNYNPFLKNLYIVSAIFFSEHSEISDTLSN